MKIMFQWKFLPDRYEAGMKAFIETGAPNSATTLSPPRSVKAAWARCIARAIPSWTGMWRSRCYRTPSPQTPTGWPGLDVLQSFVQPVTSTRRVDVVNLSQVLCPLLDRTSHGVSPLLELATKLGDEGVLDRLAAVVGLEMAFGHVGGVLGSVDEHVIPRQVFRRTRSCH